MNALLKQVEETTRKPVRATGREPDVKEMYERVTKRYPKTLARLGE